MTALDIDETLLDIQKNLNGIVSNYQKNKKRLKKQQEALLYFCLGLITGFILCTVIL